MRSGSGASANVDYDWLENLVSCVTYRNCFEYLLTAPAVREIVSINLSDYLPYGITVPSDAHQEVSRLYYLGNCTRTIDLLIEIYPLVPFP